MIKQVIFDCDGVLVDTEIVAAQIMIKTLSTYGISITADHYLRTYTGSTFSAIFESLLNSLPATELQPLVDRSEIDVYKNLKAISGMPEVVQSISLPKVAVSNSYLWQVKKALQVTNLTSEFGHCFSSQMVENPKPAADVYLLAARKTGFEPSECLVIEDSKSGVTAAHLAGMPVIGFCGGSHILKGHQEALKEKGAMLTADTPNALLLAINDYVNS